MVEEDGQASRSSCVATRRGRPSGVWVPLSIWQVASPPPSDHAQDMPMRCFLVAFAQVRTFPPAVCKPHPHAWYGPGCSPPAGCSSGCSSVASGTVRLGLAGWACLVTDAFEPADLMPGRAFNPRSPTLECYR